MPAEEKSNERPHIEALRDIAWVWDPLELSHYNWREQGGENEYDRYAVRAFEMLIQGHSHEEAIEYLIEIERSWMNLEVNSLTKERASRMVATISALISKGDGIAS